MLTERHPRRRPRGDCPICGRDTALTGSGLIGRHLAADGSGDNCLGVGMGTDTSVRNAEQQQLAVLVYRYPSRARELVAQLDNKGTAAN